MAAHSRISADPTRSTRPKEEDVKHKSDIIFEPTGEFNEGAGSFTKLINDVVAS